MKKPQTWPDAPFSGEVLLHMVATALVELSRHAVPPEPVYSDKVQKAFNHLVLRCLQTQTAPPASVPEMARWAETRPLRAWPLDLPEDWESLNECLVDQATHIPNQRCFEWEIFAPDVAAEQFENAIVLEAIGLCRAAGAPESYTAFRRLLTARPVLSGVERALLIGDDPALGLLIEIIKRCYDPAPAALLGEDGLFATCARCQCLLTPMGDGWRCELDRCRREAGAVVGRRLDPRADNGVFYLRRPLRVFVTGPGIAELELEKALARWKVHAEMWPGFDAYDLRITLPNRQVWAIDVKDRANPRLLGIQARPFRPDPPYNRAFLVVPQYRFDDREDYKRVFDRYCSEEAKGRVTLLSDTVFLRRVREELNRITADTAATTTGGFDA